MNRRTGGGGSEINKGRDGEQHLNPLEGFQKARGHTGIECCRQINRDETQDQALGAHH